MSLLNQVLQDLDERAPSEGRSAMRLSLAPPVEQSMDAGTGDARAHDMRPWAGVAVFAAFAAAVWVFYPADRGPDVQSVLDRPLPVPVAVTAESAPVEASSFPPPPKDPVNRQSRRAADAASVPDAGSVETPSLDVTRAAKELPASKPEALTPHPVEKQSPRSALPLPASVGRLPISLQGKADVDYLPLKNTQLPKIESTRPKQNSSRSAVDLKVKTAKLSVPHPLEQVRREIELGELSFAEYLLQQRLRNEKDDLEARELLVGLMLRGERYDAAMQQLDEGLRHDPGHIKFSLIKARLLAQSGQDEAALRILLSFPRSSNGEIQKLQMLGALYQKQSHYEKARDSYRSLLDLTPSDGPAWVGLAISLDGLGDPAAREAYGRALRLGGLPTEAEAYALLRIGQMESEID